MFSTRFGLGALAAAMLALPAMAEERAAIIIANRSYSPIRDVSEADRALSITRDLRRAGFEVTTYQNVDADELTDMAGEIIRTIRRADRTLIFLSGHVVTGRRDAWLLASDSHQPNGVAPGLNALSIGGLIDLMAEDAGSAVLLVGEPRTPVRSDDTFRSGFSLADVAQGVTVFAGPIPALATFASETLLDEGTSYRQAADAAASSIRASGFISATVGLVPSDADDTSDPAPGISDADLEFFYFARAQNRGTEAAYREYLDRYPNGRYSAEARASLRDLTMTPEERAQQTERELGLSRDDRRQVQADLTLLGFDTRGVDGIFGNGTRAAIRAFQREQGFDATGYLTAEQLARLDTRVRVRRQEIEAQDAAYWRETGRLGTERGYRDYLNRYPDGLFSDLARRNLAEIDEARRAEEAEREAAAWRAARDANTIRAYRDFLSDYPDGRFADEAEARLEALQDQQQDSNRDAAQAQEDRVLNNPISRVLAERRLAQLGHDPGTIDGVFDRATRRAIRRFQRAEGLTVTGYVDTATVARLLTGGAN